ncbi:hypothetical protein [Rhizobium mongolense]|uniref:Uncharacterized protein n=1 Tax=Rhizobium mongolense TaxID=57676 RepID=A0ABR6IM65_9HYPH|nr:hypothetical protein [Rhizobium mongolense]MBB4228800.1 hypothetical protein [Rhizobium mongolense]
MPADIAPPHHFTVLHGDKLRMSVLDHVENEFPYVFERGAHKEGEIPAFTRNDVESLVIALDVPDGDRFDDVSGAIFTALRN